MSNFYKTDDRIGGYTLLDHAGNGGFGEVWRAKNDEGNVFALKIITNIKDGNREFKSILKLQKCEHDSLIKIDDAGITDDEHRFLYYIMPLADDIGTPGEYIPDTLRSRIKNKGKLSPETVYKIAEKIANALGSLHKAGFIHRDIKPDNIIFVNGQPVLADIGLVTTSDVYTSRAGTYDFLPPYVLNKKHEQCPASDFYALGMTLLCALYGTDEPEEARRRCGFDSGSLNGFSLDIVKLYEKLQQQSEKFPKTEEEKKEFIDSTEKFLAVLQGTNNRTNAISTKIQTQKQKSGCLKKILIFAVCWILLGIIGTFWEKREKKESNVEESIEKNQVETTQKLPRISADTKAATSETLPKKTEDTVRSSQSSPLRHQTVGKTEPPPLGTRLIPEEVDQIKDLLEEYKLTPDLEQRIATDSYARSCDENVKRTLQDMRAIPWNHWGPHIGLLRDDLIRRKYLAERLMLPQGKAEDIPIIKRLLEKYQWFAKESENENELDVQIQKKAVQDLLQQITKQGKIQDSQVPLLNKKLEQWQDAENLVKVKNRPDVRKLLSQYKLTPEEEKACLDDSSIGYTNDMVQESLLLLAKGTGSINYLESNLQSRKQRLREHFDNKTKKIPAGSKAEDVEEIKKMLEQYHWFDQDIKAEIKENSSIYPTADFSISRVESTLHSINQTGVYNNRILSFELENALRSFAADAEKAKKLIRIKQIPEIKEALRKFAIPESIRKRGSSMSATLLAQLAEKETITNSEFNNWRWWLEHEWKEAQKLLQQEKLLANKLPEIKASTEKIFSATDTISVQFRYLEDKQWQTADFTVSGVENEAQLEKEILKSPVFRFNQTMQFHICKVVTPGTPEQKYRVNYQFRKNKRENWQILQKEMGSVPTVKIARNALFWQYAENAPECEIKVQKLEKVSEQIFNFSNIQSPEKTFKTEQYIDLSEFLMKPFSTDALVNNGNNSYLADFYNFWSHEYTEIPQNVRDDLTYRLELWKQDDFKKIPQKDALYAEFFKREIQLVNAANAYCQKYGKAHHAEESQKDFAQLVLMMEMRRTALQQLEINLNKVGAPARRYKPTKVY